MHEKQYIHGYDGREQDRLIAQAEHWGAFIYRDLDLRPGQRLLEMGCGAGAVLGVVGSAFPNAELAGIDIESKQIERARRHLAMLGINADLRVGDAAGTPWTDESFDHVFFMWMLEHLKEHDHVLREARRVLKAVGRITITETDYNFVTYPASEDFALLMHAWRAQFSTHGDVLLARRLGPLLLKAGFGEVRNRIAAFHHFRGEAGDGLARMANYHADYIEPEINSIARAQSLDLEQLRAGIAWLRHLHEQTDASISGTVYRATAVR